MSHYFENDSNVKSEERIFSANICGANLNFYSDNGVFNKSGIDYGSRLLIEEFIKNYKDGKVLDEVPELHEAGHGLTPAGKEDRRVCCKICHRVCHRRTGSGDRRLLQGTRHQRHR